MKNQSESNDEKTIFIVEHMETYLYQWCLNQYKAMKDYLKGFSCQLHITNAKDFYDYQGEFKDQNERYIKELEEYFSEDKGKYRLIRQSLAEIYEKLDQPACMLDMRGQLQLGVEQKWKVVIFGGILGDHPPRDRPAPIRKYFTNIRHLGSLQLATDTAILVSRLILKNHIPLKEIPMIEQPTIKGKNKEGMNTKVQMQGFSYVSQQLDISTGIKREGLSKKDKKQIYMSEGVKNLLLRDDLSQDMIM